MKNCTLCPRNCGIDRNISRGYCGEGAAVRIVRAALHFWEEPCISGTGGSGTVFFSGCNLRCVYCQNSEISRGKVGREVSTERLCEIFFELKAQGAHNINLVTPTHFSEQIKEAVRMVKSRGFDLPFVWNTGGYESADVITNLTGTVDIYLTDFKYMSDGLSAKLSKAPDYPAVAKLSLAEMVRTKGKPVFGENGLMKSGVIVRHLVLPAHSDDSVKVIEYLYKTYGGDIVLSIMNQYTPCIKSDEFPELNRRTTTYEYEKVVEAALSLGVKNAYTQEGSAAKESFIPDFDYTGV